LWKNSTPLGKMKYTRVYEILDSNYIFWWFLKALDDLIFIDNLILYIYVHYI
jgi:hypothetical protein